jgi:hypothetical protein
LVHVRLAFGQAIRHRSGDRTAYGGRFGASRIAITRCSAARAARAGGPGSSPGSSATAGAAPTTEPDRQRDSDTPRS